MSKARIAILIIGVFAVVLGSLGVWFNFNTLFADYSVVVDEQTPYFHHAFYIMSAICLLCYLGLVACGVQFIRGSISMAGIFIGILAFEVSYFIALGLVWAVLSYYLSLGLSVGAASGVANGGLIYQFFILFPFWGAATAWWSRRQLEPVRLINKLT
jgi:hypothetical protein